MRRQIRGGTVALKGVMTIRRNGKVYTYLRLKGKPLVALPDAPMNSPEFLAAYADAMKQAGGKTKAPTGTVRAMIEAYLRSDAFLMLSKAYRHVIKRECDEIAEQADDARACDLEQKHIRADLSPLPPHKSRARQKAWRQVCNWAVDAGLLADDPSDGIKRKAIPKSDGHPAWTRDEIATYRARWPIGSVPRAAMELLYWTGARISDNAVIGPGMVSDGVLTFRQQKTGQKAHVPWTCPVPAFADPTDRDLMHQAIAALSGHMTFLATAQGKTRSHKALGTVIKEAAREAGVEKSAHGLRKSRAVALAEGGATALQIGAWTGHYSLSEVAHYTAEMDRKTAVMGTERDQNSANQSGPSAKLRKL